MPDESSRSASHLPKPIIALDCDGVLLDYRRTYGQIYEQTFGKQPSIVSPRAYHVSSSK